MGSNIRGLRGATVSADGKNVDFVLKYLDFALKYLNFVLKLFDFVLKMLDFAAGSDEFTGADVCTGSCRTQAAHR